MKFTKSVLLYGGSFNPIHQGHVEIAKTVSNVLNVDEVWFIPRKYDYDGSLLLSKNHRIKMLKYVISDLSNFHICKIELEDETHQLIYTYDTICALKRKYPRINFYFLMGGDQINNLDSWHEADKLAALVHLIGYNRPGYLLDSNQVEKYHVKIIEGQEFDVSSTQIRNGQFDSIHPRVKEYIKKNHLYLKERIKLVLPHERYLHVCSTANLCQRFAISLHYDPKKAYIAGLMHDIAKGLSYNEILQIIKSNYPERLNCPSYALHAYASEYVARDEYQIMDRSILKAIRLHARAEKGMGLLAKIVYCADKLEESRPFANSVLKIRDIGFKNMDKCFILTMQNQIEYLMNHGDVIDTNTNEMIKYYMKKGEKNG